MHCTQLGTEDTASKMQDDVVASLLVQADNECIHLLNLLFGLLSAYATFLSRKSNNIIASSNKLFGDIFANIAC